MHALCTPYNEEPLVWHAVTPAMSNMRYHGADCAAEFKKPSKAAFFQPKKGAWPCCCLSFIRSSA